MQYEESKVASADEESAGKGGVLIAAGYSPEVRIEVAELHSGPSRTASTTSHRHRRLSGRNMTLAELYRRTVVAISSGKALEQSRS